MKADAQIQQEVAEQLKWNPLLTTSKIKVAVNSGIVRLSGQVDTCRKKLEAEKEVKKVSGVKGIIEEIKVGITDANRKTDAEIAEAIISALKWNTAILEEDVKVKVVDGKVLLEGEVEWAFQRESAKNAVVNLAGVRSVTNNIKLKPKVKPTDLKRKINAAFHRSATLNAEKITVEVYGSKATLKGKVRSFAEKEDAEMAVLSAPGILMVENLLEMEQEPELSF